MLKRLNQTRHLMNRISRICLLFLALHAGPSFGGDVTPKGTGPAAISEADLAALRARAAKERPAFEAFGWKVYRWEAQCYGVYLAKRSPEFIASAVKKTDTEIQISGPGEIILDSKKRIAVTDKATAKLRNEAYEISGGRIRVAVQVP